MPSFRKSATDLRTIAKNILEDGGKVTNFATSGVARSMVEIGIQQVLAYFDSLDFHTAMGRLSTSSGLYLDLIGESRGVSRTTAQAASVTADSRTIRFYTKDGSTPIASLLSGGKIPSGTVVQDSGATLVFSVPRDVYVDQTQVDVFVPVTATTTGADYNVGRGVLTSHNLGITQIAVVNTKGIFSGEDVETDANYRYRISRSLDRAAGGTAEALRLVSFAFPEVSDVIFRPYADGVGSFEALIIPLGNDLSSDILLGIRTFLQNRAAFGTVVQVRLPDKIPVEITVQLTLKAGTTDGVGTNAKSAARIAIINYISQLPLGGIFVLNQMVRSTLDVHQAIHDLRVLVYRFRGEAQVLRNVEAEADEVFVLSTDAENPVRVI